LDSLRGPVVSRNCVKKYHQVKPVRNSLTQQPVLQAAWQRMATALDPIVKEPIIYFEKWFERGCKDTKSYQCFKEKYVCFF